MDHRLDQLIDYPFQRLAALLGPVPTRSNTAPLALSVGEPQEPPPDFASAAIAGNAHLWGKYPPLAGTPELRGAIHGWLGRRYGRAAAALVDPERQITPLSGTREGLFLIAQAAFDAEAETRRGARPVVLIPNPFYQVYSGAAVMAGAEPVFLPATRDTGFLPDFGAVPAEVLERTALVYLCTPANPQGAVAGLEYLKTAIGLARRHGFLLAVDECYAEIYDRAPPPGALQACAELGNGLENVAVFHSLSKRSRAAGLRSGFVAAAPELTERFLRLRNYGGAGMPLPIQAASAALWNDDAHAEENRARHRTRLDIAERLLAGRLGFYRPEGGFFLWLDVGDGEEAARRLWREGGVRTLPGLYLARPDAAGQNPGAAFLRVALVHDLDATRAALEKIAQILE